MTYQPLYQQYGQEFGTPAQVLQNMAQLESTERADAVNQWDSNAKLGTPSGGIMQYIQPTYNQSLAEAQQARPDIFGQWGKQDWMNPEAQIALAS